MNVKLKKAMLPNDAINKAYEEMIGEEIAKNKTVISVNYMRGDDEVFWTCDTHKKDLYFIMKAGVK